MFSYRRTRPCQFAESTAKSPLSVHRKELSNWEIFTQPALQLVGTPPPEADPVGALRPTETRMTIRNAGPRDPRRTVLAPSREGAWKVGRSFPLAKVSPNREPAESGT